MKIYTVGWDLDGYYDLDGSLDELFNLETFDPVQIMNGEIVPYKIIDNYGKLKKYKSDMDPFSFIAVLDYNTLYTRMGVRMPTYVTLTDFASKRNKINYIYAIDREIGILPSKILNKAYIVGFGPYGIINGLDVYNFYPLESSINKKTGTNILTRWFKDKLQQRKIDKMSGREYLDTYFERIK